MIDLRSDTVTKPTKEMREFMALAPVGDDVFGDDPTVNELQVLAAELFGHESALFCASGTMTNQIAIMVHCQPGDEVICHEEAHIYRYEGGGIARNAQTSVRLIRGNNGRIAIEKVTDEINPVDPHYPQTKLLSIEDTANRGGGRVYDFKEIEKLSRFAKENGLKFHLDGARVFNALAVNNIDPKVYGAEFDSISVCLSKGLGAPVGSLLIGSKEFINKARTIRKVLGGGMRQAGIVAAGGIYALRNNVKRLQEDHGRAMLLGNALKEFEWVKLVWEVETNIVVVELVDGLNELEVAEIIKKFGILCVAFGKGRLRFTLHLGIDDNRLTKVIEQLPKSVQ